MKRLKVLVFFSGRGSNLGALINFTRQSTPKSQANFEIVAGITDNPSARGLELLKAAQLPVAVISRPDFSSKESFWQAILQTTQSYEPDLIALAGFMRILPISFINYFPNRIINIHPSLLPQLPGLDTHNRAIAEGLPCHGCTVHLVDGGIDTGAIIAQSVVPVLPEDTAELLAERVLVKEHQLYPWVLDQIALGEINLDSGNPSYSETTRQLAAINDFFLPT